jgi:RHS repeat-associated protein
LGCLKLTYITNLDLVTNEFKKELTSNFSNLQVQGGQELTNHLGNVLATITDRKIYNPTEQYYEPVITMKADYYAFGMLMPNRFEGVDEARHLFNGMEHDMEVSGEGNSYTTQFRQYDPRLGRWKSLDPLMAKYPQMSPYVAFNNNPVFFIDPLGLEGTNGDEGGGEPVKGHEKGEEGSNEYNGHQEIEEVSIVAKRPNQNSDQVKGGAIQSDKVYNQNTNGIWKRNDSDCIPCTSYASGILGSELLNKLESKPKDQNYNRLYINRPVPYITPNYGDQDWGDIAQAFSDGGDVYASGEGLVKYLERTGKYTSDLDLEAIKKGKFILKHLGTAGDIYEGGKLVLDVIDEGEVNGKHVVKLAELSADAIASGAVSSGVPHLMIVGGIYFVIKATASDTPNPQAVQNFKNAGGGSQKGGGGLNTCFISGTQINISMELTKSIDKLTKEDSILSYNPKSKGLEMSSFDSLIIGFSNDVYEIYLAGGYVNRNTSTHPYYILNKGWSIISENSDGYNKIELGDTCLVFEDGVMQERVIEKIKKIEGEYKVYTIKNVYKNHTFFANSVLVHNK